MLACILALTGFLVIDVSNTIFEEATVIETLKQDTSYTYVELSGDEYYFEYEEDGAIVRLTETDIMLVINMFKTILNTVAFIIMALAGINLLIAILLLVDVGKNKNCTGKIITLLVMSILIGNIITTVLMIVALTMQDKKPTLENINEYTA